MTKGQEHLLKLLKELDEICRQNDIQYCIAGGTLIGSVRHRGFVPWDDDADLYMTRDNFLKLVEVAKKGGLPNGRTLECQELNREYFNVFARYIDCTSTAIHKAQLVTEDTAGEVIDILQLDPIPSSVKVQKKHFKYMLVYSDLVNESTVYLHRQDCARLLYIKYLLLYKLIGRDNTLAKLEKKMFNYPEDECGYYFMRWGGTPLIFEKDMFSEYIRVPYENIETSIPKKYNDYLIYHYGEEWDNVPDINEQMSHMAVHCFNTDYRKVKQTYLDTVNKKEIEINQRKYKRSKIRWAKSRHKNLDLPIIMKGKLVVKELMCSLHNTQINLEQLYERGDYARLCKIFTAYYNWQGNAAVSGRDTYAGLYRYLKPILLDLPLNVLVIALRTQMDIGKASKSYRTIEIYEHCKKNLPKQLGEIKDNIIKMRKALTEYSYKNYDNALELANEVLQYSKNNKPALILKIKCLIRCNSSDDEIEEVFTNARGVYPKDVEIKKLWIDYYYSRKDFAVAEYKEIRPSIVNGFTRLDLLDYEHGFLMELMNDIKQTEEIDFCDMKKKVENALKLNMTQDEMIQFVGIALDKHIECMDYRKTFEKIISFDNISDCEEFTRVCIELLVKMGEEKVVADTYVKTQIMSDKTNLKAQIKGLLKEFDENKEPVINMKLKKLYADIICKEFKVKEAYDIYRECFEKMYEESFLYDELLEKFLNDVNQIEYMETVGAWEMRQKNILVKFNSEEKFISLADAIKNIYNKRNGNEYISKTN